MTASEKNLGAEPEGADKYYECQRRDGTVQTWIGIVHVRVTACLSSSGGLL